MGKKKHPAKVVTFGLREDFYKIYAKDRAEAIGKGQALPLAVWINRHVESSITNQINNEQLQQALERV